MLYDFSVDSPGPSIRGGMLETTSLQDGCHGPWLIHVTTATPPAARPAAARDSECSAEYLKSDPAGRAERSWDVTKRTDMCVL